MIREIDFNMGIRDIEIKEKEIPEVMNKILLYLLESGEYKSELQKSMKEQEETERKRTGEI